MYRFFEEEIKKIITYKEFQDSYYWSSSAAKKRGFLGVLEQNFDRARATRIKDDGSGDLRSGAWKT